MIQKKRTRDSEDGKAAALARAARHEEQRWCATLPADKALPPEEIGPTRAERRAMLELQVADGSELAKRQVDEIRGREHDDNAERERLRNGRKRPHKHLPAGLTPLTVVIDEVAAGKVPVLRFSPKGTPGSKSLVYGVLASDVELVMPELARDAAALRTAFDVEPCCDSEDADVASVGPRTFVRKEIADSIRSAATAARKVWIPIALELVTAALIARIARARGAISVADLRPDLPPPPTTASAIYEALVAECHRVVGLTPPEYVDADMIEWMLCHFVLGASRGGGRSGKLSAKKMRAILADEKELTKHRRLSNAKPV